MALPPEPIEELLAASSAVVEAEVVRVLSHGAPPPKPAHARDGATSVGTKAAEQVVVLKVTRALKGAVPVGELTVEKPLAAYALAAGNKGAFFLQDTRPKPTILGRYGPDTYRVESVDFVLGKLQKK